MNKLNLTGGNIFQTDFSAVLEVFCRCLSELYAYDANQLEYIESEIYANTQNLIRDDDHLQANEFDLDNFKYFVKVIYSSILSKTCF